MPRVKFSRDVMVTIADRLVREKMGSILEIIDFLEGEDRVLRILGSEELADRDNGVRLLGILENDKLSNLRILEMKFGVRDMSKDYGFFL